MEEINKIILAAVKRSMFGKSVMEDLAGIDLRALNWLEILRESVNQTIPAMVIDGLDEIKEYIPKQLYMAWMQYSFNVINSNERINQGQRELIELLNSNDIPYVILKGMSASYNYFKPELRSLGDIDFLIKPEDKERTKKILSDNEYIEDEEENSHHAGFKKNKNVIEMHFEITGIPYGKPGDVIRDYVSDIVETAEKITIETNEFNVPSAKMQGIVYLLHMIRHLIKVGIGLRHLCDWAAFVDKQLNDEVWESHYKSVLESCGLLDFTLAFTWTCVKYLGLPEKAWMKPVDDETCENIIDDILKSGNFGRKDDTRAFSGKLAIDPMNYDKKTSLLRNINNTIIDTAHTRWPKSQKNPLLLVLAYIYFPLRHVFYMITGKRAKLELNKLMDDVNERGDTYRKLNIFKT